MALNTQQFQALMNILGPKAAAPVAAPKAPSSPSPSAPSGAPTANNNLLSGVNAPSGSILSGATQHASSGVSGSWTPSTSSNNTASVLGGVNSMMNSIKPTTQASSSLQGSLVPGSLQQVEQNKQNHIAKDLAVAGNYSADTSSTGNILRGNSIAPSTPLPSSLRPVAPSSNPLSGAFDALKNYTQSNTANAGRALDAANQASTPVSSSAGNVPSGLQAPQTSTNPVATPRLGTTGNPAGSQQAVGSGPANEAPSTEKIVQQAGLKVDNDKAALDSFAAAMQQATTDTDKAYYTNLYNEAKTAADKSQADYEALLQQSEEEKATQAALDNETASLKLGQADVSNQPIPLGFITGQNAALERSSLARAMPLQQKLSRLQAQRQAALDVMKEKESNSKAAFNAASSNLENFSRDSRTRTNQLTDAQTTRAQKLEDDANKQYTLSQGQKLVDASGKLISQNAPKPTSSTNTSYGATNIPAQIKNDLVADVSKPGVTLAQLYQAYPEVSSTYLESLFNSINKAGIANPFTN